MAKKTRHIQLKAAFLFMLTACTLGSFAQENGFLRNGNELYESDEFEKAEAEYQKAVDANEESYKAHFNLGDALFEQKKDSLAKEHFSQALVRAENKSDRADALYNLGNVALRKKDWQGAIDHFRESLLNKAGNKRAQYNLSYAMKKLKHQQESQRKSDGKDKEKEQKKDPKSQKQQKQKEGQDQQDKQQKQPQQKQDDKEDPQSEKDKEAQKQQEALNRKEVQKLLEAVRKEEREVQKRIMHQKLRSSPKRSDKEW